MTYRPIASALESLEPRRLLAYALLDRSFAEGGDAVLATRDVNVVGVNPLKDGGSIVQVTRNEWRRFDAKGKPVGSYAGDGSLNVGGAPVAAVDPAGGRVAMLIPNAKAPSRGTLRIFGADGHFDNIAFGVRGSFIAVDSNGRVLVGRKFTETNPTPNDGNGPLLHKLRISRFVNSTPDATFGSGGTLVLNDPFSVRMLVDPDDGIVIIGRTVSSKSDAGLQIKVLRLDASGGRLSSFGNNGFVDYEDGYDRSTEPFSDYRSVTVNDALFTASGSLVIAQTLETVHTSDGGNSQSRGAALRIINPDGSYSGDPTSLIGLQEAVQLAGDADNLYVVSSAGVMRLDPVTFAGNTAAPTAHRLSADLRIADAAVDAAGRLLILGTRKSFASGGDNGDVRRSVVAAYDGFGDSVLTSYAPGKVTRLGDGTVDVNGTSKNDSVVVRQRKGKIEITVNGKQTRFSEADVTAMLIHTGKGNDNVRVYGEVRGNVSISGGAGNDILSGGDADDLVEGGDGNDYLEGRRGDDRIYGGRGQDTLLGSVGADRLYGESDNDTLYSSNAKRFDDQRVNILDGGRGLDYIVRRLPQAGSDVEPDIEDEPTDDMQDDIVI